MSAVEVMQRVNHLPMLHDFYQIFNNFFLLSAVLIALSVRVCKTFPKISPKEKSKNSK